MNDYILFLIATAILTAILIVITCEKLSKRTFKRIRNNSADKPAINALYACDMQSEVIYACDCKCRWDLPICCCSCNQRDECMHTCEDYNGPCDVRSIKEIRR